MFIGFVLKCQRSEGMSVQRKMQIVFCGKLASRKAAKNPKFRALRNLPRPYTRAMREIPRNVLDNLQLLPHFDKSLNSFVQMLLFMAGTKLHADAGLALRHHREKEADYVNAFFEQAVGKFL